MTGRFQLILANLFVTFFWCFTRVFWIVTSITVSWAALVRTSWCWVWRRPKVESTFNLYKLLIVYYRLHGSFLFLLMLQYSWEQDGGQAEKNDTNYYAIVDAFLLHWSTLTHLFCTSSSTVSLGHWHPTTHCRVQTPGCGLLHVGGHAVLQLLNTWPSIGHSIYKEMYT